MKLYCMANRAGLPAALLQSHDHVFFVSTKNGAVPVGSFFVRGSDLQLWSSVVYTLPSTTYSCVCSSTIELHRTRDRALH